MGLLKECRKEKVEYKIIALESTGTVLNELKVDKFKEIYEIVEDYLPKPETEENGENGNDKDDKEEEEEGSGKKLDLQHGVLNCLGSSWPDNPKTTETFIGKVMEQPELVAKNTTRKNQLALVKCLGNILKNWSLTADSVTDEESRVVCELFFSKLAAIIATLLFIHKYAQLRTETLQILSQAIKFWLSLKLSALETCSRMKLSKVWM